MRLGVLLIPMLIGPAGLILYGLAAQNHLHWMAYMAGEFLFAWSGYFYFSFAVAYAVDSYFSNTSEMLIAMNIGKQAISFGLGSEVLSWVVQDGYGVVISGIFAAILIINNLMVIVFMIFGKRIRRFMVNTWLGRLHQRTAGEALTH